MEIFLQWDYVSEDSSSLTDTSTPATEWQLFLTENVKSLERNQCGGIEFKLFCGGSHSLPHSSSSYWREPAELWPASVASF